VLEDLGSSDKPGQPGMRNLTDMQNDLEEVADNILRQPQTYFSDQTRKRIEELLHKTVNLGERVLEWTDDQAKKVNEMSGLWTVFWSDSAGGSRVVAKLQKLLEHDLFSKVLPNIDARLAQKFQKESGELRGRLSQV
jgi:tryptophan 2,3-dioxygenase